MEESGKTNAELIRELNALRRRLETLEKSESERKVIEEVLRESEHRFRSIFEHAMDGILLADLSTRKFFFGNHTICRMLGYDPDEIRNLRVMDIHPKEQLPYVSEQFERQTRKEISLARDIPVQRKDGSVFYADINSTPVSLAGKKYLLGIFRDITERKQAEAVLRESEERFRALIENAADAIAVMDSSSKIIFGSPAVGKILGIHPEETIGTSILDLLHPDDLASARETFSALADQPGTTVSVRYRFRHRDGSWRWIEGVGKNLLHDPKINGFILNYRDITERQAAEDALQKARQELERRVEERTAELMRANQAIRISEEIYKTLLRTSPNAVIVADLEGNIFEISQRTLDLYGYRSAEEIIRDKKGFELLAPEDHGRARTHLRQFLQTPDAIRNNEYIFIRKDGTRFIGEANSALIADARGKPKAIMTTVRDITDRKQTEEALRESEEKWRRLAQNIPDFVMNVTPDGAILSINHTVEGISIEDTVGTSIYDYIDPEFHQVCRETIEEVWQTGRPGSYLILGTGPKGPKTAWYETRVVPAESAHPTSSVTLISTDITERKLAGEALRESEEKFSKAFHSNPALMAIVTPDESRYLEVNEGFLRVLGYEREEVIGKTARELGIFSQDDQSLAMKQTIQSQKHLRNVEASFRTKSGELRHGLFSAETIQIQDRPFVLATVNDITEWKRVEEALRESEETYRTLLKTSPDAVVLIDLRGNFIDASERAFELFREDDTGGWRTKNAFDYIAPEDRERALQYLQNAPWEGFGRDEQWMMQRKDGACFIVELNASWLTDSEGNPKAIITVLRDITDRKLAEEALQESEEMYKTLLRTSPDAVTVVDLEGNIIELSEKALEIYGLGSAEEALGRSAFHFIAPESLGEARKNYQSFRDELAEFQKSEYTLLREDGTRFIGEVNASFIRDAGGNPKAIVTNTRDVTDRKQLEKELAEATVREQRRIGQDLHDGLGQHLTGIAFLSRALERVLEEQGSPAASQAGKIVQLVNQAITQTRSLARGLCPVGLEAHGLMSALREMTANVEDVFGISCTLQCDDNVLIHDNTVATHLYQIALEAVNNAVKHGHAREIVITLGPENNHLILAVRDDGVGLSGHPEPGRGMGLHIMRYRAGLINGTMDIQPANGGGTVVSCSFPREPARDHR